MRAVFTSSHKRAFVGSLFVFAVIAILLTTVWPCSVAGGAEESGDHSPVSLPQSDVFDELKESRPYYSPEVAATFAPEAQQLEERVAGNLPAELLPESLQPEGEGDFKAAGGDAEAAGAGGWTPLTRPYLPSGDPAVTYWASSSFQVLDNSGRLHAIYGRRVMTNIGQAPDTPGFAVRPLQNFHYATFSEGAWNVPTNLTNVSGLGDSNIVYYDDDPDGYIHVVYSAWTWGRDASRPAGDPNAYQHEQENLWYRYMSPDGTWSAPRQLTNFTGSWGLLGADFVLRHGRLHGSFVIVRNNETAPSSFRAQVGMVEGYMDTWEPMVQLAAWNYTGDPGQQQPAYWPSIDVSRLGGEVAVIYGVRTVPGALYTAKSDIYGVVRGLDGTWSGPQNISNSANNQEWLPIFVFYRPNANSAFVFSVQFVIVDDATHPPRNDIYLIYQAGGAWGAPTNVTNVAAQQDGTSIDIELDTFGNLHFCYGVARYTWTGALWQQQGAELKYTRETVAGLSTPVTILGYLFQRYPNETTMVVDSDGNDHIIFSTLMFDGATFWDQNIGYSTNAPGGDPNAFSPALMIRPNTNYTIYNLNASTFPDGDVLASWFEKGFDGGGNPTYGRMYSRYRDGTTWRDPVIVSSIPGNTDNLHVTQAGWPDYEDTLGSDTGGQQVVFETAKYDVPTTTYYDFRKYFTETVNGIWTTPQLISGSGVSGEAPSLYVDGGQRYFVLYGNIDAATGKEVLYATQQRDPTAPASTYFFAEGTTRPGFDEWICIQNSGDQDANVNITYMLETGANIDNNMVVPAHSRSTVNVNAAVGPDHDVSARVTADRFITCERPMYFDYYGWTGGHCTIGAQETSRLWYFAEGTTRSGFEEYLTIQNPSDRDARVDITYILGNGTTVPAEAYVGARSRATVNVNAAVGPEQDVSMVVECDNVAIVAERPMYFDYHGLTGGHCVMGSTSLADRWYFAEGTTREGFDTYICLQNPYNVDAVASLTFILGDGSTVVQPMLIPATSRQTLRVNDAIGPDRDVSTVVESDSMLLVERPMYFLYSGAWPGGHVATGARSPKNYWFFAEGTTRGGFVEWLCLQNPQGEKVRADLSFMTGEGEVVPYGVDLAPHSRTTINVNQVLGPGKDVSVSVHSSEPIICERPMYFLRQM